jgi:hypothetical protein
MYQTSITPYITENGFDIGAEAYFSEYIYSCSCFMLAAIPFRELPFHI